MEAIDAAMTVTKDDLRESREMIREDLRTFREDMLHAFKGVYDRQDRTNGRVGALEVTAGRHDERIDALENIETTRHQATARALQAAQLQPTPQASPTDDTRPITRREVGVAVAAIAAVWAFLKYVIRAIP